MPNQMPSQTLAFGGSIFGIQAYQVLQQQQQLHPPLIL